MLKLIKFLLDFYKVLKISRKIQQIKNLLFKTDAIKSALELGDTCEIIAIKCSIFVYEII